MRQLRALHTRPGRPAAHAWNPTSGRAPPPAAHRRVAVARRLERRHVDQVCEVGAAEAGGALCDDLAGGAGRGGARKDDGTARVCACAGGCRCSHQPSSHHTSHHQPSGASPHARTLRLTSLARGILPKWTSNIWRRPSTSGLGTTCRQRGGAGRSGAKRGWGGWAAHVALRAPPGRA